MGKTKAGTVKKAEESPGRVSVIHLQGPTEEREWLTLLHKKTHLPKTTIVRLALNDWAKKKGLPASPASGESPGR